MFVYEIEDGFEVFCILESDTHFNGEESGAGLAEGAEYAVDFFGVAQESAAALFFINGRGGAAHV